MTDSTQALRQCAAQLNRAKTKAAELEHASRAGWAKVTELDEENKRLRAANLDCIDHFNAIKAERDELLAALKCARWRIANLVGPAGAQGLDREALTKIDTAIARTEA